MWNSKNLFVGLRVFCSKCPWHVVPVPITVCFLVFPLFIFPFDDLSPLTSKVKSLLATMVTCYLLQHQAQMRNQRVITSFNDFYLCMRYHDSQRSEKKNAATPVFISPCSALVLIKLRNRIQHGLLIRSRQKKAARSRSGLLITCVYVCSMCGYTLSFSTFLSNIQLSFKVLLHYDQTPGLSFIKLLRATPLLLSESH